MLDYLSYYLYLPNQFRLGLQRNWKEVVPVEAQMPFCNASHPPYKAREPHGLRKRQVMTMTSPSYYQS